jgi:hypothetical protein
MTIDDFWDTMSEEDRLAILEGIAQLDNGEYRTKEEVDREIKSRFGF